MTNSTGEKIGRGILKRRPEVLGRSSCITVYAFTVATITSLFFLKFSFAR